MYVEGDLTKHDRVLEVEVKEDDHLPVAGLEEGVLDVVVHDVYLVPPDTRIPTHTQSS